MTEPINLAALPAPDVVETLDYEAVLAAMLADLRARNAAFTATVESDPLYAEMEATAYRETLVRGRVNDAARSVMLPHAAGADLDNLAALFNVARLVVTPGDSDAVPPVPAVMETDAAFRRRVQLKLEAISTAGSRESYVFHALSASPNVRDAAALSPAPCEVDVIVMAYNDGGHADVATRDLVTAAVSADKVRPLGDRVVVRSAEIINFTVSAVLTIAPGPDAEIVRQAAVAAVQTLTDTARPIGQPVKVSALYAALHQPGVLAVELQSPGADVDVDQDQAARLTALTVSVAT